MAIGGKIFSRMDGYAGELCDIIACFAREKEHFAQRAQSKITKYAK